MKAYTDHPFYFLGDTKDQLAPVREIKVLSWDRDKYCKIKVSGRTDEIRAAFIYQHEGRNGQVPALTIEQLRELPYDKLNDPIFLSEAFESALDAEIERLRDEELEKYLDSMEFSDRLDKMVQGEIDRIDPCISYPESPESELMILLIIDDSNARRKINIEELLLDEIEENDQERLAHTLSRLEKMVEMVKISMSCEK